MVRVGLVIVLIVTTVALASCTVSVSLGSAHNSSDPNWPFVVNGTNYSITTNETLAVPWHLADRHLQRGVVAVVATRGSSMAVISTRSVGGMSFFLPARGRITPFKLSDSGFYMCCRRTFPDAGRYVVKLRYLSCFDVAGLCTGSGVDATKQAAIENAIGRGLGSGPNITIDVTS